MELFLRAWLPRVLPVEATFEIHAYRGKSDLLGKLEAAFGLSGERAQKVKNLQAKLAKAGMKGLADLIYSDVTRSDLEQAKAWFYREGDKT